MLLIAAAGHSEAWTLSISTSDHRISAAVVRAVSRKGAENRSYSANLPGKVTISPGAGDWLISVDAPGYWHEPLYLSSEAPRSPRSVLLWRTGQVQGRLIPPSGQAMPTEVTLNFRASPAVRKSSGPSGELVAPVEKDGRWTCQLPALALDVHVRARSYLTHFFWDVEVSPAVARDLHGMTLVHGGSIVGEVGPPPGVGEKVTSIQVVAVPVAIGNPADPSARARISALQRHTNPNARGFYHLDGLAAGEYLVSARLADAVSDTRRVQVLTNGESRMLAPLIVEPPGIINVVVVPARGPDERAWKISLFEYTSIGHDDLVAVAFLDDEGAWSWKRARRTQYRVAVGDREGNTFANQTFEAGPGTTSLPILIEAIRLTGTVRLGDQPVAARIWFGGKNSVLSVKLTAGEAGTFDGMVQAFDGDSVEVTVESASPPVNRTLRVPVQRRGAELSIDVVLPATTVLGRVVRADGTEVIRGLVTLSGPQGLLVQTHIDPDGRFVLHGLPPGQVTATAAVDLEQSQPTDISIPENTDAVEVTLTLEPGQHVSGQIMSASGAVPGAKVIASATDRQEPVIVASTTDAEGKFASMVTPGARQIDVTVAAPGFAFRMFHAPVPTTPMQIPVQGQSGSLHVVTHRYGGDDGPEPFLLHNGAVIPLQRLVNGWIGQMVWSETSVAFNIPMVEPGHYSVCESPKAALDKLRQTASPVENCRSGYLAGGSVLSLKLE